MPKEEDDENLLVEGKSAKGFIKIEGATSFGNIEFSPGSKSSVINGGAFNIVDPFTNEYLSKVITSDKTERNDKDIAEIDEGEDTLT